MLLLNFAHPFTAEQLATIISLLGEEPAVREISVQVDRARPVAEVVVDLADATGLTRLEWQTVPFILNPPALAPVALALIAEMHGRCGHFPAIINIRPTPGAQAPQYEVAEIVNMQAIRDMARSQR